MDSKTGLYYNWNRYYDPIIGRYTTKDPLTYIDGWNYYVYLKANPLMNADPEGKYGLMGAIVSTGFSAGTQFALNMAAGADWKRALRCIDMADVLVSAALGAVGPGLGNIVKKPPADAVLTQGQNAYIYIMKVQPTGYVFKKGLEWRPFANGVDQCGNPRDDNCEELKITNAISPFLQ